MVSLEEVKRRLLLGNRFVFISAEKRNLSPEANRSRTNQLELWLRAMGSDYVPTLGRYDGGEEHRFFVHDFPQDDALWLAKRYDQESILTEKGLVYTNDGYLPLAKEGHKLDDEAIASENYTYFPTTGRAVSLALEKSKRKM